MIHVIGESHAEIYGGFPNLFKSYIIPQATTHNLIEEHSTSNSNAKIKNILNMIPATDPIMFVVGEIDCRLRIYHRYIKEEKIKPLEQYIENTVDRYITYLLSLKREVAVLTVPPAGYYGAKEYPMYGSPEIRAYVSKTFNEVLLKRCGDEHITFIDIYDKIVLPNGLANPDYLKDHVHLNNKALQLIIVELKKKNLIRGN